jgi:O-antigen/teichoic acid export membrane protein
MAGRFQTALQIARDSLKPGGNLSQKAVRGVIWVFALRAFIRLFSVARAAILARLLAPNDFGMFGIAMLAISTLEKFSQTGFETALVQKTENMNQYLDTAWTVLILRGLLSAFLLFGIAPYVADFFNEPMAKSLLRVLGLSLVFKGFSNIGTIYFRKELDFHKQFVFQLLSTLVDLGVAIAAAFMLRSAWALVYGLLAGSFVGMVSSYLVHPYRPRLAFDRQKAKDLFKFGRWILGSTVLIFLATQGDDIFLGKMLGVTALGLYQMAFTIASIPSTEITRVISQVSFPVYAKLQTNLLELRRAYLMTLQVTALLAFPLAVSILALASDITQVFLGNQWLHIIPTLQVLSVFGLIRSFGATTGPIFNGTGHPEIPAKLVILEVVILAALIYPLVSLWGIAGAAWATLIAILVTQIVGGIKLVRLIKLEPLAFLSKLGIPLWGAVALSLGILVLKNYVLPGTSIFHLLITSLVGVVAYFCALALLDCFIPPELGTRVLLAKLLSRFTTQPSQDIQGEGSL